ncbi:hypothetical protein O6H91_15G071000 [Diphasiastrum complanatum]|uniref:Uncharacterized protein n=1 Tax=Diphasiastrum complanatum TaxID=34168 RepID=A0ACC2BJI5_DIPCM|nr:hypothetical protein O6H91_15G071000 [Diphasiastrum complanatum]
MSEVHVSLAKNGRGALKTMSFVACGPPRVLCSRCATLSFCKQPSQALPSLAPPPPPPHDAADKSHSNQNTHVRDLIRWSMLFSDQEIDRFLFILFGYELFLHLCSWLEWEDLGLVVQLLNDFENDSFVTYELSYRLKSKLSRILLPLWLLTDHWSQPGRLKDIRVCQILMRFFFE